MNSEFSGGRSVRRLAFWAILSESGLAGKTEFPEPDVWIFTRHSARKDSRGMTQATPTINNISVMPRQKRRFGQKLPKTPKCNYRTMETPC
ncbi:MAG: hypothetical protein MUD08_04850 [Cytophagales bacterium]|nr:hypothetical protein [Cytophagales bacterium]